MFWAAELKESLRENGKASPVSAGGQNNAIIPLTVQS